MMKAWNLVLGLAVGLAGPVCAQSYPARPVHIVVIGSSVEEFGAVHRDETVRTGEIAKAPKIQPN